MSSQIDSAFQPYSKPVLLCGICEEKEKKYCCPKCSILYCSLVCFKEHKDQETNTCKDTYIEKSKLSNSTIEKSSKAALSASLDTSSKHFKLSHIEPSTLESLRDGIDEEEWLKEDELLGLLKDPKITDLLKDAAVQKVLSEILKTNPNLNERNRTKNQLQNLIKLQDHLVEVQPVQNSTALPKVLASPRHPLHELVPAILSLLHC